VLCSQPVEHHPSAYPSAPTWASPSSSRLASNKPSPSSRPIAALSFFCGIGTTFIALRDLGISPVLSWSWETDDDCKRVTSAHTPQVRHWGDALASDASQVAQYLHQQCPDDTLVVICSSPPCTDFSQIRASQPGLKGTEGCKFRKWVQWFKAFRSALKRQHVFLLENVVPSASTHAELDQLVGVPSFVIDASSWSLISRPRLWWTNTVTPPSAGAAEVPLVLAGLARWRKYNRCWQLLPSSHHFPKQNAADCQSASFHPEVQAGRLVFPCLTTPAPSDEGRNPPGKRRRTEDAETLRRWAAASRQYPPINIESKPLLRYRVIGGRPTP